ncbi:MAG: acyl-CoA dehydrogenase family protein [Dehalococcoidia bacterium]
MDWNDSPEQAAFRSEVQTLINEKLPERYRQGLGSWDYDRKSEDPEIRKAAKDWGDALAARGWFAPQWPKEYGGAGMSPMELFIFRQEMALADAPHVGGPGHEATRLDPHRARLAGAEGRAPAAHPLRRSQLAAGLLGAGLRLRPRLAADPRRARW